jgi:hypothetical protein
MSLASSVPLGRDEILITVGDQPKAKAEVEDAARAVQNLRLLARRVRA